MILSHVVLYSLVLLCYCVLCCVVSYVVLCSLPLWDLASQGKDNHTARQTQDGLAYLLRGKLVENLFQGGLRHTVFLHIHAWFAQGLHDAENFSQGIFLVPWVRVRVGVRVRVRVNCRGTESKHRA